MIDRHAIGVTVCCGCAVLVAAILSTLPVQAEADETLSLEDIVRLFVQGMPSGELIRRIENARVDFDLAEEMLEELRLAGLPDEVIDAMKRRQLELHPPETPTDESEERSVEQPRGLTLRVTLQGERKLKEGEEDRGLQLLDLVSPETLSRLGVKDQQARITNVAIYVACHASTHVPDHWRGKSPLGRDFNSVRRHKLLAFHSEATSETVAGTKRALLATILGGTVLPDEPEMSVLTLQVPGEIHVELDPTEEHDLSVGIAVQIDGRYYRVVSDETENFVPSDHQGSIDVTVDAPGNLDPMGIGVRVLL